MTIPRPEFPSVDPLALVQKIHELPIAGKQVALRSNPSCASCRRSTYPLGKLLYPGWVTCSNQECSYVQSGKVCELFPSPYGRTVRRSALAVFCKVLELPSGRVLVQRQPIVDRAEFLANAHKALIDWQRAIDTWDRYMHPDEYDKGIVTIIPPRWIDDVLALRATSMPLPMSPVQGLPEDIQLALRRVILRGEESLQVPF